MKQERRKAGGHERDLGQRDPKREQREPKDETVTDEPTRRLDGPAIDDSFRGKSDGEILQRYEF
jgi:hypothetical protein